MAAHADYPAVFCQKVQNIQKPKTKCAIMNQIKTRAKHENSHLCTGLRALMNQTEERILRLIDDNAEKLQVLCEDLFHHAEQGFHEYRTAGIAAKWLKDLGLTVTEGLAGTGVKAAIGNGEGPCIALVGELDGIRCPGHPDATESGFAHSCGHYAQIASVLGAALALTDPEVRRSLSGSIVLFAVPAEEYLDAETKAEVQRVHGVRYAGGKSELIRRGDFDGIDLAVTDHIHMAGRDSGADLMLGNAAANGFIGKTVILHGRTAHAAAAPHDGVNALNAASLGLSAIGMLRETFREKDYVRIHPVITKGGTAVNMVPDEVVLQMMVRAAGLNAIEDASAKTDNAFRGAALAIGASCEIINAQGYMPVPESLPQPLLWAAAAPLSERGVQAVSIRPGEQNTASTDVGDLAAVMPVINFTFGGTAGELHSEEFRITAPYVAHVMPAQMMALTAYQLLKDGAAGARQILETEKPRFTKEEYCAYIDRMFGPAYTESSAADTEY